MSSHAVFLPPRLLGLSVGLILGLLLLPGPWVSEVGAQPSTDIVVLDLYPHGDHVHVGSMVVVTDREGYDNQPWFLDHDRLLPELDDVGYYAWAGEGQVAVFRVGEPPSLHLADPESGELHLIQEGIGASVQPIPGTDDISFVDRSDPELPFLHRLDPSTGEVTRVAEMPQGNPEHTWLSAATALVAYEGVLYRSTDDPARPWHPIVDLGRYVGDFSRLAVSAGPSGLRIAVVRNRDE